MKTKTNFPTSYKLLILPAVLTLLVFTIFATTTTVNAAIKNDAQIQNAAEAKCGKGGGAEAACRSGYRNGYSGDKSPNDACGNRQDLSGAEKVRCQTGYTDGNKQKFADGAADGNTSSSSSGGTSSFFGSSADQAPKDQDGNVKKGYICGGKDTGQVTTRFNFGCVGNDGPAKNGPILDLLFSFIKFLSAGVGIIIVGSIILAGIQYSASEGKPDATQAAKNRIQNAFIGLIVYIFAFSLVQFLVPGGLFN